LAEENEVVVIDDLSTGKKDNLAGVNAKQIPGSITDLNLKAAFEGATSVFHLAAIASVKEARGRFPQD
jgi:UDP-glucose 4-epimerase